MADLHPTTQRRREQLLAAIPLDRAEPARTIWKRLDMLALSTIKHQLNALVDMGLVARIDRRDGRPNLYRRMPV